jgi:hypothetical protein
VARDLGAFICFEDEAARGLRPPKGRTWAPRGARPVLRVRGTGKRSLQDGRALEGAGQVGARWCLLLPH